MRGVGAGLTCLLCIGLMPFSGWTDERHADNYAAGLESRFVGKVTCGIGPEWSVSARRSEDAAGREILTFDFSADAPRTPPKARISFDFPARDAVGRWHAGAGLAKNLPPNWGGRFTSSLAQNAPVVALFSDTDANRGVIACSESQRTVGFSLGVVEETGRIAYEANLFDEREAPIASYRVSFLLDFRDVPYDRAIREAFAWYETLPDYEPISVPESAFDPLYSFWYSYHQNLFAEPVEKECALAAADGFKTVIVDDGWQTDDTNRGYAFCGDWQVSTNRFPDFAAHVSRVHALGLKYMLWFSVPYVGRNSANYARFRGKFLFENERSGTAVLDPRFPGVRTFLTGLYAKALKEWDLDGLKLDFIDAMQCPDPDPAATENYAGRDIRSLAAAIDRLMKDIRRCARGIKPNCLIEFRQTYVGPSMRQYGNIFRAADCPMDYLSNRVRTIDLRLSSGPVAVHSDMLMWEPGQSPDVVAKQFWSILFSVPQISMRLGELSPAQRAKLREVLSFWNAHRETLVHGELHAVRPDLNYPLVTAYGRGEQVVAVYDAARTVEIDRARGRRVFLVNATSADRICVRENGRIAEVSVPPFGTAEL